MMTLPPFLLLLSVYAAAVGAGLSRAAYLARRSRPGLDHARAIAVVGP